jgi:hypothetical protein
MNRILLSIVIISSSFNLLAQNSQLSTDPDLGSVANFILFTGAGAVANTGTSTITGDVGSQAGAIAGFVAPSILNGSIENANAITLQATIDLTAACVHLQNIPATVTTHSTIYGTTAGETIYPGVYTAGAAASIIGTLILDAQGDTDALFIFKIGGALSSVAGSEIILTNGASSDNVFWIAIGAVGLGANTIMKGTFIGYPGAVSLGANSILDGKLYATAGAIAISSSLVTIPSYNLPFGCVSSAYLFQNNDVYTLNIESGTSYQIATDITAGTINATGYNPTDGYIWGSLNTPEKTIVRIGSNFNSVNYLINELPSSTSYIGDVSANGVYYLKGDGTAFYRIDVDPNSINYTQYLSTDNLSQNLNINDWAFNSQDGNLYSVEKNTNILYRIEPATGTIIAIGEVPILSGFTYTYDAVYFDADGRFYIAANETGTLYAIQSVQDLTVNAAMEATVFSFGPSSANSDGARCPTATVLQEICNNGIDDDGDGLIDCDDSSCSSFIDCVVSDPATTGSNDGGLESNSRLSEQINKRNFNRAKNSFVFDRMTAKRISKKGSYLQHNIFSSFTLEDFIPLDVINEDEVINASPSDLVSITNATEIYGVDYLKNDVAIASVLVLKTDNGVYEHTKYICDRLLGAELTSVSTMKINGQSFIKSIIKNRDGTNEFVLSLSAKLINNDTNFAIESHWNLDKYEQNATFYNFQIWTNTIDDLFLLSQEVLDLLEAQKLISSYTTSRPPTVFVRKGKYLNGALDIDIVNVNATETIHFDANFRSTETSDFDHMNTEIDLFEAYHTNLQLETGNLFDIGFRIGDGITTPDDLFMSDGPWGIDYSQDGTVVDTYEILPSDVTYDTTDFPLERNIVLKATTNSYIAAYRALTPRFKAVDLKDYNSLEFSAHGTGTLEITFVKASISIWEEQYKSTIVLSNSSQDYVLPVSSFDANNGTPLELTDVVTIVFTMTSLNGATATKELTLENLRLTQNLYPLEPIIRENTALFASTNPLTKSTVIQFTTAQTETVQFVVYNLLGKIVYQSEHTTLPGKNEVLLKRNHITTGIYICKIISEQTPFDTLKLVVR